MPVAYLNAQSKHAGAWLTVHGSWLIPVDAMVPEAREGSSQQRHQARGRALRGVDQVRRLPSKALQQTPAHLPQRARKGSSEPACHAAP